MKEKRRSLLTLTICLFAGTLYAQGGFITMNTGMAAKMSAHPISGFVNVTKIEINPSIEQINVSLGEGMNIGGTLGYMVNKNIGFEFGISHLFGSKTNAMEWETSGTFNSSFSASMTRFNPGLIIAAGFKKINPYAKFGILLGSGEINYGAKQVKNGDEMLMNLQLNGGTAFGLNTSIGALFSMNNNMSFFAEITSNNLSYSPTRGAYTVVTYNETDILSQLTVKEKEIEFVNSYEPKNYRNDSMPTLALKERYPFGSLGLNMGLKYNF